MDMDQFFKLGVVLRNPFPTTATSPASVWPVLFTTAAGHDDGNNDQHEGDADPDQDPHDGRGQPAAPPVVPLGRRVRVLVACDVSGCHGHSLPAARSAHQHLLLLGVTQGKVGVPKL